MKPRFPNRSEYTVPSTIVTASVDVAPVPLSPYSTLVALSAIDSTIASVPDTLSDPVATAAPPKVAVTSAEPVARPVSTVALPEPLTATTAPSEEA